MKFYHQVTGDRWQVARNSSQRFHLVTRHPSPVTHRAFTLVEIAICLAIIGIALVAIIGVLPRGLDVQRENRERTVINQDATVFMEAIRNGARGADDLTNYVYAIVITNDTAGSFGYVNPALEPQMNFNRLAFPTVNNWQPILTNGANIVGLLGTLEYGYDHSYAFPNHLYAYVRSISGPAVEKPPQDNQIMRENTLTYRLFCVNAPMPVETNTFNNSPFARQMAANQREVRMTFLWPLLPNGNIGNGRQTFRTTVAGQLAQDVTNNNLYFYQSQSFRTNTP